MENIIEKFEILLCGFTDNEDLSKKEIDTAFDFKENITFESIVKYMNWDRMIGDFTKKKNQASKDVLKDFVRYITDNASQIEKED